MNPIRIAAIAAAGALALAGCGSKAHHPSGSASSAVAAITASPQYQAAKTVVDGCLAKQGGLTALASHTRRQAFEACVVPRGHLPAFNACVLAALGSAHLLTHAGRDAFAVALVTCAEHNR